MRECWGISLCVCMYMCQTAHVAALRLFVRVSSFLSLCEFQGLNSGDQPCSLVGRGLHVWLRLADPPLILLYLHKQR